jgi:hypothetical protein
MSLPLMRQFGLSSRRSEFSSKASKTIISAAVWVDSRDSRDPGCQVRYPEPNLREANATAELRLAIANHSCWSAPVNQSEGSNNINGSGTVSSRSRASIAENASSAREVTPRVQLPDSFATTSNSLPCWSRPETQAGRVRPRSVIHLNCTGVTQAST